MLQNLYWTEERTSLELFSEHIYSINRKKYRPKDQALQFATIKQMD